MADTPVASRPTPPAHASATTLTVGSWVLYDLANTVYAATLTFVFTPFVIAAAGNKTALAATNFASMVLAGLLVPLLGALADATGRAARYLGITTALCIVAVAGWFLPLGPWWLLGTFFVANLAYNVALTLYNSLLPSVAAPDRIGRVSGIGVGIGYFGTIAVLLVLMLSGLGSRPFFLVAAALFLIGALPCLLFVRDRRTLPAGPHRGADAMRSAWRRLGAALRELPRHPALLWFLLGNFCLVDVLNTAVVYFADFTVDVFTAQAKAGELVLFGVTFSADNDLRGFVTLCGLALNTLALVTGLSIGAFTDRAPLTVLRLSGLALLGALVGGAAFGGHSALGYLLTLVALGAFGLTGIWTAGRKIVVVLAPRERVGEYFGLYGITVKLSVFGGLVYGGVADGFGSKPALLAQSAQLLIGLGCLLMVRLPTTGPNATEPE